MTMKRVEERPEGWTIQGKEVVGGGCYPERGGHAPAREIHSQACGAHVPTRAMQVADREVLVES
jgi:hypothetical protein